MYAYLTAPFPFRRELSTEILTPVTIGLFIAAFLVVFEPFGTDDFESPYKYSFLGGYGVIVSSVLLLAKFVPGTFCAPLFSDRVWTVGKQIVWTFSAFVTAISACFLYWAWFFDEQYSFANYWSFSRFGLVIGIFPIIILILIDYIVLLKRFSIDENIKLPADRFGKSNIDTVLKGQNTGEELLLNVENFLYASAHRNYVEINHIENAKIAQTLLRLSLANLLNQLPPDTVIQCHRSFIVNKQQVARVSGNAQGYRLHLKAGEIIVPVSRSKGREIVASIRSS